jgi:hypothetical protein
MVVVIGEDGRPVVAPVAGVVDQAVFDRAR